MNAYIIHCTLLYLLYLTYVSLYYIIYDICIVQYTYNIQYKYMYYSVVLYIVIIYNTTLHNNIEL